MIKLYALNRKSLQLYEMGFFSLSVSGFARFFRFPEGMSRPVIFRSCLMCFLFTKYADYLWLKSAGVEVMFFNSLLPSPERRKVKL